MTTKTQEQAEARIGEMVRRIVENFDPDKIILFGSFASGTADADSDVVGSIVYPALRDGKVLYERAA